MLESEWHLEEIPALATALVVAEQAACLAEVHICVRTRQNMTEVDS